MKTLKISGFALLLGLFAFLNAEAQTPPKDTVPKPPDTLNRVVPPPAPQKKTPAKPPATVDTVYQKRQPGQPPPLRPDTAGDRGIKPKMKKP